VESRCRYTRINGARCAMPALNGQELCYEHQQRKRQAQRKPAPSDPKAPGPLVNLVYMDDHTSVLANLNAIAEAFAYGLIDHRQLSALTRLMQTCLKTLHQKHELRFEEEGSGKVVQEVTYDEDGLALAIDPPPAPAPVEEVKRKRPRYSDLRPGNTVEISAGAALDPACTLTTQADCLAPEPTAIAEPKPAAGAEPLNQQLASFQALILESEDKSSIFKHFRYSPESDRLFSDTYLPPEGLDARDFASLPVDIQKLVQGLA
jgi:hypothetical protein